MAGFNHFVLTRFNLRLWWKEDKRHNAIQTKEWMEERFRLFEKFTLPSLRAQTCQDFLWICLFDGATCDKDRERIAGYANGFDRFHPVYLNEQETRNFQDVFRREISRRAASETTGLLTTYLDNDDALHCRFIEETQRRAASLKFGTIISYTYGIQYYEEMNLAVRIPYRNNHFLTYYERMKDRNRTVWGFWHFSIFKYKNLRIELIDNRSAPMWAEVIHRGNIDNDVKMTLRHHLLTDQQLMQCYGVDTLLPSRGTCRTRFLTSFQWRFLLQIIRRGRDKIKCRRLHLL